jgi:hypothetical protein
MAAASFKLNGVAIDGVTAVVILADGTVTVAAVASVPTAALKEKGATADGGSDRTDAVVDGAPKLNGSAADAGVVVAVAVAFYTQVHAPHKYDAYAHPKPQAKPLPMCLCVFRAHSHWFRKSSLGRYSITQHHTTSHSISQVRTAVSSGQHHTAAVNSTQTAH